MITQTAQQLRETIREKIPQGLVVPKHDEKGHHYLHTGINLLVDSVTQKAGILDSPHLKQWSANLTIEYVEKNWELLNHPTTDKALFFKAATQQHVDVFHDAGDIGTRGHNIVDAYLQDWMREGVRPADIRTYVYDPAIEKIDTRLYAIALSANKFFDEFEVEPVASELLIFSVKHKFAGTLDNLMMVWLEVKKGDEKFPAHKHLWFFLNSKATKKACSHCHMEKHRVFALVDWKTSNSIDKPEYAMQVSAYEKGLYEMTGIVCDDVIVVRLFKDRVDYECKRLKGGKKGRGEAFKAFLHLTQVYDWMKAGGDKPLEKLSPRKEVIIGAQTAPTPTVKTEGGVVWNQA